MYLGKGRRGSDEPRGGGRKRQTPVSSFVPASLRCSLPSGGLEDTDPPFLCTHSITLSAIVPIPVSPDLLHSPLHMDKWLGPGPGPGPSDPRLREEWG